jgi:hypothetical protein
MWTEVNEVRLYPRDLLPDRSAKRAPERYQRIDAPQGREKPVLSVSFHKEASGERWPQIKKMNIRVSPIP